MASSSVEATINTEASRGMGARYAVLFRVHFWDAFAERQYQRLCATVGRGDVFILVDETSGPVPIPHGNVVSHTQKSVLALGLSGAGHGNMLWFNGDYPLYLFYLQHSEYDYYVMTEYDVVVQRSLDEVVGTMAAEELDFVGLSNIEAVASWPLTRTCLDAYTEAQIRKCLICISMYSNRAVRHLFERRLEHSRQHEAGLLQRWPYCEAFVPTEIVAAGMAMGELSRFGPTERYDWKPAVVESELAELAGQGFVHPVLDTRRFVPHVMRDLWPPEAFFDPRNKVGRRLRRAPVGAYGAKLAEALWRRVKAVLRKLSSTPNHQDWKPAQIP